MLRLGISKQDRVFEDTTKALIKAQYPSARFDDREECDLGDEGVKLILVKDIDQVAFMAEQGELDGLLIGADIALEVRERLGETSINSLVDLRASQCKMSTLAMEGTRGRIEFMISKYPGLCARYLNDNADEVSAGLGQDTSKIIVKKFGSSSEAQIRRCRKQNLIAGEIVVSGRTTTANNNQVLDEVNGARNFEAPAPLPRIMDTSLQLFSVGDLAQAQENLISGMRQRIEMFQQGEKFKLIKYNASKALLEDLLKLTPTVKNPDLIPTGNSGTAVTVMVPKDQAGRLMVSLTAAGAEKVIAQPIEAAS